jgi:hypothetical protein
VLLVRVHRLRAQGVTLTTVVGGGIPGCSPDSSTPSIEVSCSSAQLQGHPGDAVWWVAASATDASLAVGGDEHLQAVPSVCTALKGAAATDPGGRDALPRGAATDVVIT